MIADHDARLTSYDSSITELLVIQFRKGHILSLSPENAMGNFNYSLLLISWSSNSLMSLFGITFS